MDQGNERIGSVLNAGTNDDVSVMTDADWLRNSTKLSAGFGGGGFDAIAEESNDESSHPPSVDLEQLHNQSSHAFNESSNSIHSNNQQQYQQQTGGSVASSYHGNSVRSQVPFNYDEETADQSSTVYDNTRLSTHTPKDQSCEEINVTNYQNTNIIIDADEVVTITPSSYEGQTVPDEWLYDENGNRYHPKKNTEDPTATLPQDENKDQLTLLQGRYDEYDSLFHKRRKLYTIITICAAVVLALTGLVLSFTSLKDRRIPVSSSSAPARTTNNGGYIYVTPGRFGGGSGGLTSGNRRQQLVHPNNNNPYHYGPGQAIQAARSGAIEKLAVHEDGSYTINHDNLVEQQSYAPLASDSEVNPSGAGAPQGGMETYQTMGGQVTRSSSIKEPGLYPPLDYNTMSVMTSTPLTSYTPPADDANDPIVFLSREIDGAFVDLSILPYNPTSEMPVVMSVPFGVHNLDHDSNVQKKILGVCYQLVQCSNEGDDILSREHDALIGKGDESTNEGRRSLLTLVEEENFVSQEVNQVEEPPRSYPLSFNPPLSTEVVDLSTFVNVDCSTAQGLDRAISQDLLSAGIVDVVHTTSLTDMSRLFVNDGVYGRPVVMIRNPLHRALAKYEWMRVMDENVKTMTLSTFAKSGKFT